MHRVLIYFQVMETKEMLFLVTEYAPNGEIFGERELIYILYTQQDLALFGRGKAA